MRSQPDPVMALVAPHLDGFTLLQVRRARRATLLQRVEQRSELSHGDIVRLVALDAGLTRRTATRLGTVLDLLHFGVDLADNLADEDEDRRAGRRYHELYRDIPRATLIALPALLVAAALTELAAHDRGDALRRTTRALGLATHGQGLAPSHTLRARLVSGAVGALYALPLWLGPRRAHADQVERWGVSLATWAHLRASTDPRDQAREAAARRRLEAAWPRTPVFVRGALSREKLLGPALV